MYSVRDSPMPNGNQMPGTPIGSSNSSPKNETVINAKVSTLLRLASQSALADALVDVAAHSPAC